MLDVAIPAKTTAAALATGFKPEVAPLDFHRLTVSIDEPSRYSSSVRYHHMCSHLIQDTSETTRCWCRETLVDAGFDKITGLQAATTPLEHTRSSIA